METQYAEDNTSITFSANNPLVPDGKLPSGRNGSTAVFVSII